MALSKFQQAIVDFAKNENGSAVIEAVAGSGKTFTLVELAKVFPTALSVTFLAFNKSIAMELQKKLPQHIKASTVNALGHGAWFYYTKNKTIEVDKNKSRKLFNKLVDDGDINKSDVNTYLTGVCKLVGLAKSIGLVPTGVPGVTGLVRDTDQAWFDLIDRHSIQWENNGADIEGINIARKVLKRSIEVCKTLIDYDDQIYLPVIFPCRLWQNDVLFIDEAQDINACQRALLRKALKPSGRLFAVGDPHQAIYGFRGADSESLANIRKEFSTVSLPLSISYRCPKSVVAEAQRFVSHIEAAETAPEGSVTNLAVKWEHTIFNQTDGIVCRNTAPLIDMAYSLIRNKVPCAVLGREIGQGLVNLVKKMDAVTVDELEEKLIEFRNREITRLNALGKEEKAEAVADWVDTLFVFIDEMNGSDRTIKRLMDNISSMFSDENNERLLLCTIHKAKGLEWERVFILDRHLMPSKWARQDWQKEQEKNLQYVAVTRAKRELYYIETKNPKSAKKRG